MNQTSRNVFLLPDLGEGLTEAGLVQWLVAVGDTITTDQPIAEVETAKSIVELPSPFAGVVTALHGAEGDTIDVGAPVIEVADALADVDGQVDGTEDEADSPVSGRSETAEHEAYRQEERAGSGNVLIGYGTSGENARGRRRPRPTSAHSTSVSSAPPPAGTAAPGGPARHPVAVRSPLVRRLARHLGVDVHAIVPSGSDGTITRADVLRTASENAAHLASVDGMPADDSGEGAEIDGLPVLRRERLSPLRKAVSAKLSRSRREIPDATVWVDVDATSLWEMRPEMVPSGAKPPSLTAIVARFALIALEEYPLLASRLGEDGGEIISFEGVNLGVAADTERGLMVPVIPRADDLSITELDSALRELAETARSGGMPPERLRGSTFTLNNYGGFGVDGSAAIINHPDVAILGIGRIIERPWVVDGDIVARRIAQLSLVFDHRVCDGGYAAGFLSRIANLVEHPLRTYGRL